MKTIVTFCLVLLLSLPAASQDLFGKLTEKYASQEGFSATNLTRDMFDLYLKKKQVEPNTPVYETLKKLSSILVVSQSSLSPEKSGEESGKVVSEIHQLMLNHYKSLSFTLFKTENRMGEDLKVFLKKTGEKINALSLITASPTRVILVELNGDIDLSSVSDLNKALNIRGLENLSRINGQPDVFSNWKALGDYNFNFNEDQMKQFQLSEEQMKQFQLKEEQWKDFKALNDLKTKEFMLNNKEFTEQEKEMIERSREMAEKYQRHPIFLSAPGDTNVVYIIDGKKADAKEIKNINPDQIKAIEVIKPDKEKPGKKGEIRITTRK
jgi:hypothetical protein